MQSQHPSERRLSQAVSHVTSLWFPVNTSLLSRIRDGLSRGAYDLDVQFLVEEIKTDFSLYLYVLRELAKRPPPARTQKIRAPSDVITAAGIKEVKSILNVDPRTISTHDLDASYPWQLARLSEALISATTVETCAERERISGDLGYGAALIRQLGLTLIAWNYPTVYQRAMSVLKERAEGDIDAVLSDSLGFSPLLLGKAVVAEWRLPIEVLELLEDREMPKGIVASPRDHLRILCEVGEALARANDPEVHSTAIKDWLFAKEEIHQRLGFDGLKEIEKRVDKKFEHYRSDSRSEFKELLKCQPETKIHRRDELSVSEKNPFISSAPLTVKKKLKEFYQRFSPEASMKDTVRFIVKEVIPYSGFSGGVIYTHDPTVNALIPRTLIGKVVAREVTPLTLGSRGSSESLLETAFQCQSLVTERHDPAGGELTEYLHVLGQEERVGVLYLERPGDPLVDDENARAIFKAVHKALCDALKLK